MSKHNTVRVYVEIEPDEFDEIEQFRNGRQVPPTRQALLRSALRRGMKSLRQEANPNGGGMSAVTC